jgi:ectoine hydroxylase-related dioxygenase (phytanoyl-CoA dioxygenase family)
MLTAQQVQEFKRNGFLICEQLLTAEQVARANAALTRLFHGQVTADRRPPAARKSVRIYQDDDGATRHLVHGRLLDDDLWQIMTDARLAEMAAQLLETPSVSLTEDQLFEKPPRSGHLAMHQDFPYQTFASNDHLVTLWLALTDVTMEMAPMEYVPGSHTWPVAAWASHFADGNHDDYMEIVHKTRPPGAAVEFTPVLAPAGGGAFHHTKVMHGSRPNVSNRSRRALALHYAAEDCRVTFGNLPWHPDMWQDVSEGGRIANHYFPIVY